MIVIAGFYLSASVIIDDASRTSGPDADTIESIA